MITIEEIRDAVNYVFRETSERVVKMHRYCSTANALISYSTPFIEVCNSENCDYCKEFHTLIKQEVEKQLSAK